MMEMKSLSCFFVRVRAMMCDNQEGRNRMELALTSDLRTAVGLLVAPRVKDCT